METDSLKHLLVTIHGDGFLCGRQPTVVSGLLVFRGYRITKDGWHGNAEMFTLTAESVRYGQELEAPMQPFGDIDIFIRNELRPIR